MLMNTPCLNSNVRNTKRPIFLVRFESLSQNNETIFSETHQMQFFHTFAQTPPPPKILSFIILKSGRKKMKPFFPSHFKCIFSTNSPQLPLLLSRDFPMSENNHCASEMKSGASSHTVKCRHGGKREREKDTCSAHV